MTRSGIKWIEIYTCGAHFDFIFAIDFPCPQDEKLYNENVNATNRVCTMYTSIHITIETLILAVIHNSHYMKMRKLIVS